jgi:hypothetical protein
VRRRSPRRLIFFSFHFITASWGPYGASRSLRAPVHKSWPFGKARKPESPKDPKDRGPKKKEKKKNEKNKKKKKKEKRKK